MSVVNEPRLEWPLSRLLIAAELPQSTFYYHIRRLADPDRYQFDRELVLKIYHQHKGRYGYLNIIVGNCKSRWTLTIDSVWLGVNNSHLEIKK